MGEGHHIALEMLLRSSASVNAQAMVQGRTELQAAAGGGHHLALDILLWFGAEVGALPATNYGLTALQAAITVTRMTWSSRLVLVLIYHR